MTTLVKSLSAQWAAQIAQPEYSAAVIADMVTTVAAAPAAYNRTVWSNGNEAVIAAGATQYRAATGAWWYTPLGGGLYDTLAIDTSVVQANINAYLANQTGIPLMADIEAWNLADPAEYDDGIANLQLALGMWQDQTDRVIGLWSMMPAAQYVHPTVLGTSLEAGTLATEATKRSVLSTIQRLDDKIATDLLPYVDFVMPRVYQAAEDNVTLWKWAAAWMILESIRIADGKPVYPSYWDYYGNSTDGYFGLSEANFVAGLQFVSSFPGIAGTAMWEGSEERIATYEANVIALLAGTGVFADPE